VLLEPLSEIDVVTPDDYMGDVFGDLSSRRGQILGTEAVDSSTGATETRVRAIVPESELHSYAGTLQSMTQGRATFTKRFKGYEEMPHEVAQRVIDEATKEKEEEAAVH
jgi:elongation factor G